MPSLPTSPVNLPIETSVSSVTYSVGTPNPSLKKIAMNNASKTLLLALSLSLAACGGPSDPKTPADTATTQDQAATIAVGEPVIPKLPAVPSTPAEAPAGLTAVVTAGNPNAQLTQIGTFVDAVMPGMAAFLTPQTLMQQIEGILGVVGLRGLDMNQPLYVIMLDDQQAVLVATVSSEAEVSESLQGTKTMVMLHDGFAAIGSFDALTKAGGYALSNLVRAQVPELPTVDLHLGKIMSGPHADTVRQQLTRQMANEGAGIGAEVMLAIMSNIEVLSMNIDANPQAATIRLIGKGLGGEVKDFTNLQRASSFAMTKRLGTGPWAMAMAGRLDLSAFIPLLVKVGEANAQPIVTQIAAQLGGLNGEMGVALNIAPERELVAGMELSDGKGLSQLVDTLLGLVGKKDFDLDGMKGKLRLAAIKTRAGSLHEVKLTPTTEKLKADYGKKGVSAFFGVVADTLLVTFGPKAKTNARTLTARSGALPGKGTQLSKAVTQSKSLNESFMLAFDLLGLQSLRPTQDVEPVVIGVGFTGDSFTGRLVLPSSIVKEAAQGAF